MSKFDEGQRVLEQLRFFKETVLKHTVAEFRGALDFSLVDEAISDSDNRLLHFFSKGDTTLDQVDVVLAEVQSVVGDPKVVMEPVIDCIQASFLWCLVALIRIDILRVTRIASLVIHWRLKQS